MSTALFTPLALHSTEFRNRIWVSPMCQYAIEAQDGVVGDWHLAHLGSYARGGAGLVIAEATGVVPEGRISAWCPGIWNDEQADAWSRVVSFIHSQGAKAGIQLAHAGRKASAKREWYGEPGTLQPEDGGWTTVAPSAIAFPSYDEPHALTEAEIAGVIDAFASAAVRACKAGFDVLEIHAAHGYLIHQFLSPLSNQRTDQWGGSFENRIRLLREIVLAVRAAVARHTALFVRISATDWVEPEGWTLEQSIELAKQLKDIGVDLIDVSTGGLIPGVAIKSFPGYQVPFAEAIREGANIPVTAVGQITEAHQANQIIEALQADAVMVGREFLRDPHFALRAAHDLDEPIDYWPMAYRRGKWH